MVRSGARACGPLERLMPVTFDGREVGPQSEDWRHECECRWIAALPGVAQRRAWLRELERVRGKGAVDRIKATLKAMWEARTPDAIR